MNYKMNAKCFSELVNHVDDPVIKTIANRFAISERYEKKISYGYLFLKIKHLPYNHCKFDFQNYYISYSHNDIGSMVIDFQYENDILEITVTPISRLKTKGEKCPLCGANHIQKEEEDE